MKEMHDTVQEQNDVSDCCYKFFGDFLEFI